MGVESPITPLVAIESNQARPHAENKRHKFCEKTEIMKIIPPLLALLLPLLGISCKGRPAPDVPTSNQPAGVTPPSNSTPGGTGSGTRSDYQPTTGPAGQVESGQNAPPSGHNPAPSNPNVTPPAEPKKDAQ